MRSKLHWFVRPGSSLSRRVVHAGFWALALRLSLRSFNTVKTIILARILAPEDFGLMGIALLTMALLETFTQTGFRRALIHRTGDIRPYLNTAWTIGLLRALAIAGVLALAAPLLASFLGDSRATPLVRALALVFIFTGLTNIGIVYFEKELEFQKRFLFLGAQTIAEVGVAIGLAVTLHSVWALVYGAIAGSVVHVIASYLLHPYRPRLRLEWAKAGGLFRYGKWVLCSRALQYLVHHLDDLLVARLVGAAGLGLYRMAYNMSEMATTEVTHVAGQVLFPTYSKLQERRNELQRAYLRSVHVLSFLCFPISGGFLFLAPSFTGLVLGAKWLPMVPALQLLIMWGLVRSIGAASGPLFSGIGRPDLSTKLQFAKMVFLAALIYPMTTTWGITGAAAAVLITDLPVDAVSIYLANRMVESPIKNIWQVVAYPLLNTLLMLLALHLASQVLAPQAGWGQFIALIALGALTYGAGILVCRVAFGYTIDGILTRRLGAWLAS